MSTTDNNPLARWDINASYWDQNMGVTGNDYYNDLQLPALNRMADIQGGERALDLATGNGLVARWLAAEGVGSVVATDGSSKMVECARERGAAEDANGEEKKGVVVSYQVLDVTDEDRLGEFIKREVENVRITFFSPCLSCILGRKRRETGRGFSPLILLNGFLPRCDIAFKGLVNVSFSFALQSDEFPIYF